MFRLKGRQKIEFVNPLTLDVRLPQPLRVRLDVHHHAPPPPRPSGGITTVLTAKLDGGFASTARGSHMAYVLPDGMQVALTISYEDADGNPAKVDGAVKWSSANEDIAHVIVEGDDGANVTLLGLKVGTTQISAKADADLGDGTKELVTTLDVEVAAGEAVAGVITPAGEPEPIPK